MDDLIKAVLLGILEGITEFLPISSTGHLIVATRLLEFRPALQDTFEIFIQLGAVLAVVVFYRADLLHQLRTVRHDIQVRRFWLAIAVAVVPAALIGFLLRDFIKARLFNPEVVALALIIGGIALIAIDWRRSTQTATSSVRGDLPNVSLRQAVLIGIAQTIALIPGVSRAAASIVGGMMVGLDRRTATQFSFYLAIPTLGGATIVDLLLSLDEIRSDDLIYLFIGAMAAAVVAWFVIGWLLRYVARHNFVPFGVYRIAAGLLILWLTTTTLL